MIWNRINIIMGCVIISFMILVTESRATVPKAGVSASVIEYGIYSYSGKKLTVTTPRTATGTVSYGDPDDIQLVKKTKIVPLTKGIIFGYKWRIQGLKNNRPVEMTYRVKHPPIVNLKGIRSEKSEGLMQITPIGGAYEMIASYRLSEDYELVPGIWTITILLRDQVISEMSFQVVTH
jgi:hypothetical protein